MRFKKAIKKVLSDWVTSFDGAPDKKSIESKSVLPVNADIVKITELAIAGALLLGYKHAQKKVIKKDEYNFADEINFKISTYTDLEPVPFEEAIDFLKGKIPMTKNEWLELEPKLRFRAFTVARLAEVDHIEAVKQRLVNALENGESFNETWQATKDKFKSAGDDFLPGYFETVYRTNVQSAYNAGRLMLYKDNMPPAWELLVIEDGRTSDTCKGIVSEIGNGRALPSDHSFWQTVGFPPYHFNCRTSFRAVYDYEIKNGSTKVVNPKIDDINFKPAKGFGGNPIDKGNWWMLTKGLIERGIKYGIIGEFNRTENVIADYDELWKGYTRHIGKKGGWYDLCSDPPNDWGKNKPPVEALANAGYKVKVIPDFINANQIYNVEWSNPDIFINGLLYDIKEPEKMTSNAIKNRLKSAQEQRLTRVVLNIPDAMPKETIMRSLARQANDDNNKLTDIILIYKDNIKELKIADFRK